MRKGLRAVQEALRRKGLGGVEAGEWRRSVVLQGRVADWDSYIAAGYAAVGHGYKGVVNDVEVAGVSDGPGYALHPGSEQQDLEGRSFDVVVIGGGVIGSAIARELTRLRISVALLEKEDDLAKHTSSRNDGMVHPGFAVRPGTQMARLNIAGNKMYAEVARDLGVRLEWPGSMVLVQRRMHLLALPVVWHRCRQNGVEGARFLSRNEVGKMEPNIIPGEQGALHFPATGVLSPYRLTIAYAENAVENGARVFLNTTVLGFDMDHGRIRTVRTNRGSLAARVVINAAGLWADRVAQYANDRFFTIHGRKGVIAILDRKTGLTQKASLAMPDFSFHSRTKGGGLVPTIEGNILMGPTAREVPFREDYSTDPASLQTLFERHLPLNVRLKRSDVITYFAGVRPCTFEEDFVIEPSDYVSNLVHVAGIQSPGLASAPAIACEVAGMTSRMLQEIMNVLPNEQFNGKRRVPPELSKLSLEERAELIRRNPSYGHIVCRCEGVSEGEIVDALNAPVPAGSLDAIKRRVRTGMGRCQGGFCTPAIVGIMAREKGIPATAIPKREAGSELIVAYTKSALTAGYSDEAEPLQAGPAQKEGDDRAV